MRGRRVAVEGEWLVQEWWVKQVGLKVAAPHLVETVQFMVAVPEVGQRVERPCMVEGEEAARPLEHPFLAARDRLVRLRGSYQEVEEARLETVARAKSV